MRALEKNFLEFLKHSHQFAVPVYQRNYSWTDVQCRRLWTDLLYAGRNSNVASHFMGSIVYGEHGLPTVIKREPLMLIDGQQRLATMMLLIAALAKHFEEKDIGELLGAFSAKKLRNNYLLNSDDEGERKCKLLLSETDKETLKAILQISPMPTECSTRINENFALFQQLIVDHENELEAICQGLAKMVMVDVSLDPSKDDFFTCQVA